MKIILNFLKFLFVDNLKYSIAGICLSLLLFFVAKIFFVYFVEYPESKRLLAENCKTIERLRKDSSIVAKRLTAKFNNEKDSLLSVISKKSSQIEDFARKNEDINSDLKVCNGNNKILQKNILTFKKEIQATVEAEYQVKLFELTNDSLWLKKPLVKRSFWDRLFNRN